MATLALPSMRETPEVKELLNFLNAPGLQSQREDYTALLDYVDSISEHYTSLLSELDTLKEKIGKITDKKNPLVIMAEHLENLADGIGERLTNLKDGIIQFTKNALETVKEKGLSALGAVFNFLHVKDGLQAMSKGLAKSVEALDKAVTRVDNLEQFNQERAAVREAAAEVQSEQSSGLADLLANTRMDFENLTKNELKAVYEKLLAIGMNNDLTADENICLQTLVEEVGDMLPNTNEIEYTQERESEQDIEI